MKIVELVPGAQDNIKMINEIRARGAEYGYVSVMRRVEAHYHLPQNRTRQLWHYIRLDVAQSGTMVKIQELQSAVVPAPTIANSDVVRAGEDVQLAESLRVSEHVKSLYKKGLPEVPPHGRANTICGAYATAH